MRIYQLIPVGITDVLKLGLQDYTPFEIEIMGLQDPTDIPTLVHTK